MRGTICRTLSNPLYHQLSSITKRTSFLLHSSSFSTSSGSGSGRGRGSASPSSSFIDFISPLGKSDSEDSKRDSAESPAVGLGHGRGRGTPLSSEPILPSFSSFVSQAGSGRGRVTNESEPPPPPPPRQPMFIKKKDENETDSSAKPATVSIQSSEPILPSNTISVSVLSGAGRGKPVKQPELVSQMKEENRHIRLTQQPLQQQPQKPPSASLSQEQAVEKAMGILSRRSESEESGMTGRGGRVGMGRGTGRGMGRGRGRGRRQREYSRTEDSDEEYGGLYLGDNADGEKLAKTIGGDNMNKLVEGFEEMSSRILPSPTDDAYLEALHTNCMIEFEPEYLMGDFGSNPDIDEKPPMSLRAALEKVKPFLMAYEGIQSQEEWEEAIKETMERVPLLQEIVDYYSGPGRVTAKKQHEELERVAKTIPESAPASVKQFANRAVFSLQSNPGWGFDKKCQFMDKLAWEVSQQYK